MSATSLEQGSLARVSALFKNASGTLVDPSTVSFKLLKPDGTVVTKVYLTDVELVRDSLGTFHIDVSVPDWGTWWYRWESTGQGQAAADGRLYVRNSAVLVT